MSQILLLLENKGNRQLLQEWITRQTKYDVRVPEEDDAFGESFDLCIVDGQGFEAFRDELDAHREAYHPEFVPVLLLVPHEYGDQLVESVWTHVDDIIWTSGVSGFDSLDTFEFQGRIRSLLRIREMSRTVKENQEQLKVVQRVLRHNVRNSLNTIRGNATLIEEAGEVDRAKRIIQQSDRLLNHAEKARKVNEILETNEQLEVCLGTHVKQVVERQREDHSASDILFHTDANPRVTAIHGAFEAIGELIENAIIHNPSDHPDVTVRVTVDERWGMVSVADTGPEIPAQDHRILTGDQEPTAVDHGQGVGLWLVAWTIRRAKGTIDYERRKDGGNRVTIRLPTAE